MKNKKGIIGGIVGGTAAIATTVALMTTAPATELTYEIVPVNEYVTEMKVDAPDELSIDIMELELNGVEVEKTILPGGSFKSVPLVFEDLSRLEVKLYRLGEVVGTAKFDNGKLKANVKAVDKDE